MVQFQKTKIPSQAMKKVGVSLHISAQPKWIALVHKKWNHIHASIVIQIDE